MTIRKRRQPTPAFKLPSPYNPMTGQRASLEAEGAFPYCAMMQIAATDDQDDYVICRGYDPRVKKFFDYEETPAEPPEGYVAKPGIPVAKPYGSRVAGAYEVGQVFAAVLPLMKIGDNFTASQNPGVAADTQGHPADLDELVELLYTNDDTPLVVNWLLLDSGSVGVRWASTNGELDGDDPDGTVSADIVKLNTTSGEWEDTGENIDEVYPGYLLGTGKTLAASTRVLVAIIDRLHSVIAAACD